MTSRRGELSVRIESFELLSKALRPLPDMRHGLTDPEARYRRRYLDLIVDEDSREVFAKRSIVIAATRRVLLDRGFREVETPVLLAQAGGAAARPFITHHNALDIDMFLRIALELPLKRLIVGGMNRVFEVSRVFRNEGLDTRHNPEFTMLEAYQAFGDYHDMMDLTEAIIEASCMDANGHTTIDVDGREVDMKPPYRRAAMAELIEEHAGVKMHPSMPIDEAREIADRFGVEWLEVWGAGQDHGRGLRRDLRGEADRADVRHGSPARGLAARPRPPRRPDPDRALRARRRRTRARQRLLGAQRPRRPGRSASSRRRGSRPAATRRPSRSTTSTSKRSSTGCRRPAGSGSASTGWSCSSPASTRSAT